MGGRSHRELWPGVSKTILSNGFYSPMFLRQDRDTTYHPGSMGQEPLVSTPRWENGGSGDTSGEKKFGDQSAARSGASCITLLASLGIPVLPLGSP